MRRIIFKKYITGIILLSFLILLFTPISKPLSISKEKIAYNSKEFFELPDDRSRGYDCII